MFFAIVSVLPPMPILMIALAPAALQLADLHAHVGVVLLVLLDADDLQPVVGGVLLGRGLLHVGVGRRIVQHADLLDLGLLLQVFEPLLDLHARPAARC